MSISESPVPLQFTPFLGILAGIVATLIILILTVIIVIKIKHKYIKTTSTSSEDSPRSSMDGSVGGGRQATCHYKSFKFDTDPDKTVVKSGDSYGSECSDSGSPASLVSDHSPTDSYSGSEMAQLSPGARHWCDQVTSWSPFLSPNCEESVI